MDQNQERRRGHSHRGARRGPDRRGPDRSGQDRRTPPQAQERPGRDQVDVEQIMRDIRGRIAQRQGIDLSNQQIQDLAARRLESILDPRAMKPSLLEGLRRSAGAPAARTPDTVPNEPAFTFEDTTLYDSHRGALRLMRRLLNPLLKLFFNPNPLIRALHLQSRLNVEAAEREAERARRQTEWNALHFEIVQRLVTEVSRVSLELQSQSLRVESLDAKLEFNERRVRGIEGSAHRSRPQGRSAEPITASPISSPAASPISSPAASPVTSPAPSHTVENDTASVEPVTVTGESVTSEGVKRRRRRRRGRRTGMGPGDASGIVPSVSASAAVGLPGTHTAQQTAEGHRAQEADGPPTSRERAMDTPAAPHDVLPAVPPPLPREPDERAAVERVVEPVAERPDADRIEH